MAVYFIQCLMTGKIKIGTTKDVEKRFVDIQAGSTTDLNLLGHIPGGRQTEASLHEELRRFRLRNNITGRFNEWFIPAPQVLNLIQREIGIRPSAKYSVTAPCDLEQLFRNGENIREQIDPSLYPLFDYAMQEIRGIDEVARENEIWYRAAEYKSAAIVEENTKIAKSLLPLLNSAETMISLLASIVGLPYTQRRHMMDYTCLLDDSFGRPPAISKKLLREIAHDLRKMNQWLSKILENQRAA